jgi:DNA-directed RNA polymerase specialized sigma24 family protein
MIFNDDTIDLIINALIEEYYATDVAQESIITYLDYMATMKRLYPRSVPLFEMFYLLGMSVEEIAEKLKAPIEKIEDKIDRIRGITVVYLYKNMCLKERK